MESAQNTSYGYHWALPEGIEVPPDELRVRLDIYDETILLHDMEQGRITTRVISAVDVARAFTRDLAFTSGILPEAALWWGTGPEGSEVALWRPPGVWKVALQVEALQPPRRFSLPMPGLVFVCQPGRPPRVYAARRRPVTTEDVLYHAPLFNVFRDGRTCAGTHKYPDTPSEVPESFFASFFSLAGDYQGRSFSQPKSLLALWQGLDGKRHYPVGDLVEYGTVQKVMEGKRT